MAIALTASVSRSAQSWNPVPENFDCNGGNLLVLGVHISDDPTGVGTPTYDGVNMTASPEGTVDSTSESIVQMWYLVSPAAGNNIISVPNVNAKIVGFLASAWSGVDVADPLDTSVSDFNAGSINPSVAITTGAANKLIIDAMTSGRSIVPTANSHTLIFSIDNGSWTQNAQYTLNDGSGGITLDWTVTSDDWAMIICSFNPSGAPPAGDIESVSGVVWATNIQSIATVQKAVIQSVATVDGV